MKKDILDQLEFEKSKREILKQSQMAKRNPIQEQEKFIDRSDQKFAWEIELEQYRKSKLKDQFVFIGAIAGFAALIMVILFHFQDFANIFNEILMKFQ
ncbi:MAG: hypothetical protein IBX70_00245 [Clostridia bacterium]|nr:hypothetical protein [Clostridia bacterium]